MPVCIILRFSIILVVEINFSSHKHFVFVTNYMLMPGHPWICENGAASDHALDGSVISRLKQFSAMNNLKKLALRVSA